ncbi:MAG TPA: pyrroline-5-carboxylate reductase, partial [Candidatus Atribacteria bacterium]|nr:pyrroline-5-carboxylate reductase [Candidatus Atribacteria bacterium]
MGQLKKIGIIGAGNMGSAIIAGVIRQKLLEPNGIFVYDIDETKVSRLSEELGVCTAISIAEVAKYCSTIILSVKPQHLDQVFAELRDLLNEGHLLISIAAGISLDHLKKAAAYRCSVIRTMPNIAALVGEGITSICKDRAVEPQCLETARMIFSTLGRVEFIEESQIHGATAIAGSSPALAFQFIEALADGGVMMGLPRQQSLTMAAQALLGAARLYLETGKHPGELKDMVCSP